MKLDLDQIIRDKMPKLSPFLAYLMGCYLKRIVHQKEINEFLQTTGKNCSGIDFAKATLDMFQVKFRVHGLEDLDLNERYIFASNHPFGGLDGVILACAVGERFSGARVVVNDILMNLEPLAPIFVPVNKHGRQNPKYLNAYKDAMTSDNAMITFPAGLCSRKFKGKVQDSVWKPSFVKHAIEYQRSIVPVYFGGKLSRFFYNLHRFRTFLGVKANIEMLYLCDEMFKQRGQTFDVYFGKAVSYSELRDKDTPKIWTQKIRSYTYKLKKND